MAKGTQKAVAVFFSKDRAFQLDAALRSFFARCEDPGKIEVHALVAASNPRHASLYRILGLEHPTTRIHRERDFKADLLGIVRGYTYILFAVDDSVFVSNFSIANAMTALDLDNRCIGFSLRLGQNTNYCYMLNRIQAIPTFQGSGNEILSYEWASAEHDFAYPFEISSSVYRSTNILPILEHLNYENPNLLESELSKQAMSFAVLKPRLCCFSSSVAVSIPVNVVQNTYDNRSGSNPSLSPEALASFYSRGDRLDIAYYHNFVPDGAHQELPVVRVRDGTVPTVSIVVPCYLQAQFLADCVASVVAQTFTDWDLTIVDDGSPDNTSMVAHSLIKCYPDKRIRLLQKENGGLASARNAGIASTRGRYILPLDADDMLGPSFLDKTIAILEKDARFAIAYTDQEWFGEVNRIEKIGKFNSFLIPASNLFAYCSPYRREVWEAVNGYNQNMPYQGYEDWDFWVSAVEHGFKAARVPESLFRYRVRKKSMLFFANQKRTDLIKYMHANHPGTYRPWLRVARLAMLAAKSFLHRLKKRLLQNRQ